MYSWWHNKVLEVVIELLRAQCETANQQPVTTKELIIQFHKEGECLLRKQKNSNMKLLNWASDWKVSVDLKTSLQFPVHIIQIGKQPDIVMWSDSKKSVLLIELTVPCEENWEEAHEWKKSRYETLCVNCMKKGWTCHVIPIEVGCHWFSRTLSYFVYFKNRNHWSQFESCLILSSGHGAICIEMDLVESEKSSAWMKCVWNHHSCVIT